VSKVFPKTERMFAPLAEEQKPNGAYYTVGAVADFLVKWALARGGTSVLDPCFGGGAFLEKIVATQGHHALDVHGVERERRAFEYVANRYGDRTQLHHSDFFEFAKRASQSFDAVVGNPPFIRYHRFSGTDRSRALNVVARAGVVLSRLASSWAYFVLAAASMLNEGGRLAFVVPAELQYATYARTVLRYLRSHFRSVTVMFSDERFFPDLAEDTLLLLCDDYGHDRAADFLVARISNISDLVDLDIGAIARNVGSNTAIADGSERLAESLLSAPVRTLYRQLKAAPTFLRLRSIADVGIGYVTGNNEFFHLSGSEAADLGISHVFLQPTLYRGKAFSGIAFHVEDWLRACEIGDAGYLLQIPPDSRIDSSLRSYLDHGKRTGVPDAYKCQVRDPWYSVPHVYRPDAFLTSMSGAFPRMTLNEVNIVATNSVHIVRVHPNAPMSARELCVRWLSTASQLSAEIEGHALGGGMLKLEPTEAENVLLSVGQAEWDDQVLHKCDDDIREGDLSRATARVDNAFAASSGLSSADVATLKQGLSEIRGRRTNWKLKI
jgi:adenine-specific DNA-methyltransferase